ncbi:MAG: C69 family dipeptidase, partial [Bacteroidales bacterium]|nr:C69 family dipeptidase [Bacteroidales bacterium]
MKRIISLVAIAAALISLTGCGGKDKAAWGDYVVACGDKDLYIIDAAASTEDSLHVLWHWNVDEAKGQIPDEDAFRARVLDDCKPVDGGKRLLLTSSSGETLLLDIASKAVIFYAKTPMSYFEGEDADFSFADAYAPLDFGAMRGCEARVWSAFNILSNGWFTYEDEATGRMVTKDAFTFVDYALGHNPKNRLPLWIQPAKKLTVKDIADVMRDHFEGTPLDMTSDIGAGGNALPYRWRPMTFTYEGKTYTNERAIATQQTGFWFVGQSRGAFPDVIGGILWFGTDDAATSYLTPIYTSTNKVPKCFEVGNGDLITYSPTSSFWTNNRITNDCYRMYDQMAPFVREKIDKFENDQLKRIRQVDNEALDLYAKAADKEMQKAEKKGYNYNPKEDTGDIFASVKRLLTKYSVDTAQDQFNVWKELETTMLVKFIDGNVKAQNADGSFKHSDQSEHIPDGLTQPGYTELWKQAVATSYGEVLEVVP